MDSGQAGSARGGGRAAAKTTGASGKQPTTRKSAQGEGRAARPPRPAAKKPAARERPASERAAAEKRTAGYRRAAARARERVATRLEDPLRQDSGGSGLDVAERDSAGRDSSGRDSVERAVAVLAGVGQD